MPINLDACKATADQNVFHEGTSAYYDTFSGLVPCKVIEIKEQCYGYRCGPYDAVKFKVTADHGPYRKGEILTADASHVPPKSMIRKLQYSNRIRTSYSYSKTPA